MFCKCLIAGCSLLFVIGCARPSHPAEPGFLEGHLKIVSLKEVDLADASPSKGMADNYADYPLLILSKAGQKEIARIRAKPRTFMVISNQTVRVDFDLDTGIR